MNAMLWVLVAMFGVNALYTVTQVGNPRRTTTTTPAVAAWVVAIDTLIIICIFLFA